MAVRKRGKRRSINYIELLKLMRGKINFDYDLRKPLTKWKKKRIRDAYRDLSQYKSKRLIKPPRKRGESDKNYHKRLKSLKISHGQGNTAINGVFINSPKNAHYRINGNKISWRFTNQSGRKVREKFIPIEGSQLLESPRGVASAIYESEKPFRRIWFTFGGFRGKTVFESPDVDNKNDFMDVIEAYVEQPLNDSGRDGANDLQNIINGVIVQY